MEISEAVEMLTKFKNSGNPTEKEIFACKLLFMKAWFLIYSMSIDSIINIQLKNYKLPVNYLELWLIPN